MNNTEETLNFEQKHKEDLQRLRGFRLLDDDFMSKVFEDKACAESADCRVHIVPYPTIPFLSFHGSLLRKFPV